MTEQQTQAMRQALEAFDSIRRYGLDTLSGRVDGPDDREWQRQAVNEMTKRARIGHDALRQALEQKPVNEHQDWCASLTQVLTSMPPQPAPCNCKPEQQPAKRPATREEKIVRPGVYEVPVEPAPEVRKQPAGWVGLTAADRKEIERQSVYVEGAIRMTEAKLREKNSGEMK